MRLNNLVVLAFVVALFLVVRNWVDRKREKILDKEIVREGEEWLGQWSGYTSEAFCYFRLKRDGNFTSKTVIHGQHDTSHVNGQYQIIDGQSASWYPRLLAISETGDTVFNFYLASVTPYGSTVSKADRMVLQPNSLYDTVSYIFYRVSPGELEATRSGDLKDLPPAPSKDALSAGEFMSLAACIDLPCVQQFMKNHSTDFLHAGKGEFASRHRALVIDTAGNELIMPLSTIYVDVNPQAGWRLAHTLHRIEHCTQLMEEFRKMGFAFVDSGYYRGIKMKRARYISALYPGKVLYTCSTFQPWNLKGLYRRVTWSCYVFEMYLEEHADLQY